MFKLLIKTSGAAYRDDSITDRRGDLILDPLAHELRRNLQAIIRALESGMCAGDVFDVNGNLTGYWKYE